MPEGDTLLRHARRLNLAVKGCLVESLISPCPNLSEDKIVGRRIRVSEARGKHLLIHFDDGSVLHVHLGREGGLRIRPRCPGQAVSTRTTFILSTEIYELVCINAPVTETLSPRQLLRHAQLSRLGPDILAEDFRLQEILLRLRRHPKMNIGVALLDQRICCGIGNIYKSELLFRQGIDPFRSVEDIDDETLVMLFKETRRWMQRNLGDGRRRTRWGKGSNAWVYRRAGAHCLRCDTTIEMKRQGPLDRSTYYCKKCQTVGVG